MGYCKLMLLFVITFILLCSGIFGHPFRRHSKAVSPSVAAVENVELKNFNNLNNKMASDDTIGVPDENNVNNIKLIGTGDIDLELMHELEFQICTKHCMGTEVAVCFESANPEQLAKGGCGSKQCDFLAGVQTTERGIKRIWFMEKESSVRFYNDTCKTAIMQSPNAIAFEAFPSCYPKKHDGNVVKLYVTEATRDCPLYVIGAKLWYPPTPPPPTAAPELSTEKPAPSKPPPSSSTADSSNTLWIVIAVVSGILGIALLIGLGCLIYHCCLKKKSKAAAAIADGKKNQISTETKTITEVQTPVVKQETEKEKAVEEGKKGGVKEKVTTTKEETEEQKPKKKKASKQKSKKQKKQKKKESKKEKKAAPPLPPKAPTPNRTKPTQEETPPNATGPTFEETMAQSMVSQKPVEPTLHVLEKIIVPERQFATSNRSKETDSLSGNHDLKMVVENPSQVLARFYDNSDSRHQSSNEAKMQEIKDFYPVGKRGRDCNREEVSILCCRISTMFKTIETMRTTAKKKLQDHGAKFDKNGCITKMPPGTLYYVQNRATAEYIRAFAFGALFYQEIDRYTSSQTVISIPLLFDLILQPRYPVLQRRKACAWIRRQMPVILQKYTVAERERLAYPICAIEEAYDKNKRGFDHPDLHTESKDEIKPPPPPRPRVYSQLCEPGEIRCLGGSCIPQTYKCDGYPDCPNGSDELFCI